MVRKSRAEPCVTAAIRFLHLASKTNCRSKRIKYAPLTHAGPSRRRNLSKCVPYPRQPNTRRSTSDRQYDSVVLIHAICLSQSSVTLSLTASTGRSRLHTLALPNLYCRLVVHGRSTHSLLDLPSHCEESLFNVGGVLGRCL